MISLMLKSCFFSFSQIDLLKNEIHELRFNFTMPDGIPKDRSSPSLRRKRQISRGTENSDNSGNKPKVLDRSYGVDLITKVCL